MSEVTKTEMVYQEIAIPLHEQLVMEISQTLADDSSFSTIVITLNPRFLLVEGRTIARGQKGELKQLYKAINQDYDQETVKESVEWLLSDEIDQFCG